MKRTDDLPAICLYCEHSAPLDTEENVICEKKGVVASNYHCRRFFPDLLKMPVEVHALPRFEPDDDLINDISR
ncbi:MAG: hypothetical protein PUB08_04100 [Firmicutes bacterium]|nr:hypothetical protein [Bacillota bacterium]